MHNNPPKIAIQRSCTTIIEQLEYRLIDIIIVGSIRAILHIATITEPIGIGTHHHNWTITQVMIPSNGNFLTSGN